LGRFPEQGSTFECPAGFDEKMLLLVSNSKMVSGRMLTSRRNASFAPGELK
jgi:hypothetical protein